MISFFKCPDIKPCREEEANRILQELTISVRITAKDGNLRTILDATKQYFRSVGSQINTAKSSVVQFHGGRCGLARNGQELVENLANTHSGMPSPNQGIA